MVWPQSTLDVRTELYAGGWQDVSRSVRRADRIRITHGQPSGWGTGMEPSSCELTLDNRDGRFAPDNPTGPYYASLTRNTPLRVSVRTAYDTFDRTVTNGWGSIDGLAWSTRGAGGTVAASDYQVANGAGTHSIAIANAWRETYLADRVHELVDVSVRWSLPGIATVTGAAVEPANLLLRGLSPGDYYMVRVSVTTAQAVTLALYRQDGTVITGPSTVPGLTYTAGAAYRTRRRPGRTRRRS